MNDVAALILAAGQASRFRAAQGPGGVSTKLVAPLAGKPLVRHVAEAALGSRARPILVVTGHAAREVEAALAGLPLVFAHNSAFETGLASSLRRGIAALPETVAGVLVLLGDMPRVSPALLGTLIEAFRSCPAALAVAPVAQGRRGNPVLLARALFPEVARLQGDVGARPLLEGAGQGVLEVPVEDEAIGFDIDTPQALSTA